MTDASGTPEIPTALPRYTTTVWDGGVMDPDPAGEWVKFADLAAYFTQTDVDNAEMLARALVADGCDILASEVQGLASRIRALLPPEQVPV